MLVGSDLRVQALSGLIRQQKSASRKIGGKRFVAIVFFQGVIFPGQRRWQPQLGPNQVLHFYPFGKCVSINSDIFAR
jgi:hypothetical protein